MSAWLPQTDRHAAADVSAGQRVIGRSVWFTVPGTYLLIGAAYALLPPLQGMEEASARVVLAVRWLLVALVPYAAVCIVISTARFFEGSHNPLAGVESERLKVHCRVMQNTLGAACLVRALRARARDFSHPGAGAPCAHSLRVLRLSPVSSTGGGISGAAPSDARARRAAHVLAEHCNAPHRVGAVGGELDW